MDKKVICLLGPTAVGKTDIACGLVERFPLEIISIDSAMVYRDMNIGTAKPSAALLEKAPHHLINIRDPNEAYSVAECCRDVQLCCDAIISRGKTPLLVGGTMMYFRSLQQGLSSLPHADEQIRDTLLNKAQKEGWDALYEELCESDPGSAARIHRHDTQRIQRALEVYYITGQPLSSYLHANAGKLSYVCVNFLLMPASRVWLHDRIAQRFGHMLQEGFVDEVEDLLKKWSLTSTHPSMRSVGYRQVWDYFTHRDKTMLLEKGIAATRQCAKRQLTWLRHWPDGEEIIADDKNAFAEIVARVGRILGYTLRT